jgi:chaperone required for assembly of F1-ATPase
MEAASEKDELRKDAEELWEPLCKQLGSGAGVRFIFCTGSPGGLGWLRG